MLYKRFSGNPEITVSDTSELYGERGSFRVLQFSGEAVQGAMDLHAPERIVFEYPRAMIHLMEINNPAFEDVFVIGHGIGTIARHFAEKRFKVAEIDERVVEISRKFFGYSRNNVIVGDGRLILDNEKPRSYDYILLDAFTDQGTPRHLVSREFFRMAESKLDSRGGILLNLMGRGEHDPLVNAIHTTLGDVFPYAKAFSLPSEGVTVRQNIILVGSGKPIGFQARHMAGFTETELGQGYIVTDGGTADD